MSCSLIIRPFWRRNYIVHPSAHGNAQDMGGSWKYENTTKTNYLERIQKYFSSITTWMPETYMLSSWFMHRGDLSSCTTRNLFVKFCLQYTVHFQIPARGKSIYWVTVCFTLLSFRATTIFIIIKYCKCQYSRQLLIKSCGITTTK